jgi:hypothetical protein
MGEFTTIALSISLICLTWAVVKINEKIDATINRLKRFERQPAKGRENQKESQPVGQG